MKKIMIKKFLEQSKSILKNNWFILPLIFLFVIIQLVYLLNNKVPMQWDDAWFYENSLRLFDSMSQSSLRIFEYVKIGQTKPPLINLLMTTIFFTFGRSYNLYIVYYLLLILISNIFLLLLFSRYKNLSLAIKIFVFCIFNLSPISVGLSRIFIADYLMGVVIFLILYEFTGKKRSWYLGIYLALGLLSKTQFIVYVFPIYMSLFFTNLKKVKNLIKIILPSLIFFLPWLLYNLKVFIDFTYNISIGGASKNYALGIKLYLLQIINFVFGTINLSGLFVFSLIGFKNKKQLQINKELIIILISLVLFILILVLNTNRAFRFAYPVLIYLTFIIIELFKNIKVRKLYLVSIIVLFLSYVSLANTTFPKISITSRLDNFIFLSPNLGTNYPYRHENWKQKEIIEKLKIKTGTKATSIILLGDYQYFNLNNFSLYAIYNRMPYNFGTIAYFSRNLDNNQVFNSIKNNDFFIYKKGGSSYEDPNFNYRNVDLYNKLSKIANPIYSAQLPDGGVALVLERIAND